MRVTSVLPYDQKYFGVTDHFEAGEPNDPNMSFGTTGSKLPKYVLLAPSESQMLNRFGLRAVVS